MDATMPEFIGAITNLGIIPGLLIFIVWYFMRMINRQQEKLEQWKEDFIKERDAREKLIIDERNEELKRFSGAIERLGASITISTEKLGEAQRSSERALQQIEGKVDNIYAHHTKLDNIYAQNIYKGTHRSGLE